MYPGRLQVEPKRLPHHLILIRERDAQLAASGCCGRFEGDAVRWTCSGENIFAERRRIMERMGEVYRGVRTRYGDAVRITVVDPRNAAALFVLLVRDTSRYGVPWLAMLKTVFRVGATAAILDGTLLFRGAVPPTDTVLRWIAEHCDPVRPEVRHART